MELGHDARRPEPPTPLRTDLLLVLFLIGFDVAARLLLHAWNFIAGRGLARCLPA